MSEYPPSHEQCRNPKSEHFGYEPQRSCGSCGPETAAMPSLISLAGQFGYCVENRRGLETEFCFNLAGHHFGGDNGFQDLKISKKVVNKTPSLEAMSSLVTRMRRGCRRC